VLTFWFIVNSMVHVSFNGGWLINWLTDGLWWI